MHCLHVVLCAKESVHMHALLTVHMRCNINRPAMLGRPNNTRPRLHVCHMSPPRYPVSQ